MRGLVSHSRSGGSNLGGLLSLRVYPVQNVVAIPEAVASNIKEPLQLLDANNYADLYFPYGLGSFEEPESRDDFGSFYKSKIKIWLPKGTPALQECLASLRGIKAVCVATDANGNSKVVGSKEYPLQFTGGFETGKRAKDSNGHEIMFYGETEDPAPFYLYSEKAAPVTGNGAFFSKGFSFGFKRT